MALRYLNDANIAVFGEHEILTSTKHGGAVLVLYRNLIRLNPVILVFLE